MSNGGALAHCRSLGAPCGSRLTVKLRRGVNGGIVTHTGCICHRTRSRVDGDDHASDTAGAAVARCGGSNGAGARSFDLDFRLTRPLRVDRMSVGPRVIFDCVGDGNGLSLGGNCRRDGANSGRIICGNGLISCSDIPITSFGGPLGVSLGVSFARRPDKLI